MNFYRIQITDFRRRTGKASGSRTPHGPVNLTHRSIKASKQLRYSSRGVRNPKGVYRSGSSTTDRVDPTHAPTYLPTYLTAYLRLNRSSFYGRRVANLMITFMNATSDAKRRRRRQRYRTALRRHRQWRRARTLTQGDTQGCLFVTLLVYVVISV